MGIDGIERMSCEWALIEEILRNDLGKSWYLKNPPKFSISKTKIKDLAIQGLVKHLKQKGYKTHSPFLLGNRYLVDCYLPELKMILHRKKLRNWSGDAARALGIKSVVISAKMTERELWRILGEINHVTKSMDG